MPVVAPKIKVIRVLNLVPASGLSGSISNQQVAFGNGTQIAGDDNFKWNNTTKRLDAPATVTLHSTGDVTDGSIPFTADNSRIRIVDVNGVDVLNMFSGGTFTDNDGSLYVGDSLPAGFANDGMGNYAQDNVAVGLGSMPVATSSSLGNTALGVASLRDLTTGQSNVAIGANAGQSIVDGINNVIVGRTADVRDGACSNVTLIGSQVDCAIVGGDNATCIGANTSVKIANTVVIGDNNVTDVYFGFPTADIIPGTLLVVGKHYAITEYHAGDDFTNVGASSNASGVVFIATGTTPTTWLNGSVISLIDATAIIHGKGDAIVFPDADPHVAGAAYWVGGVLTKSAG